MKKTDFKEAYYRYKDDIIKHIGELVAVPGILHENEEVNGTVYRFGYHNARALDYVLKLGKELGFKTKNTENVCGHIEYGEGKEIFAVICHVDVVPASGDWKTPPFTMTIKNGRLYGRGTSDDKGPAIASIYALKMLKDLGFKPKKRIRLIFGTDEETGMRGLRRYLEIEENPLYGISPDADFPLIYGEKGIARIDVTGPNESGIRASGGVAYNAVAADLAFETDNEEILKESKRRFPFYDGKYHAKGISAHAMEPDKGVSAIAKFAAFTKKYTENGMIHFICEILADSRLRSARLSYSDPETGDLTVNMGFLTMEKKSCLGLDIRYPNGLDFDDFFRKFSGKASEYGLKCEVKSHLGIHYIDPDSPYIGELREIYRKHTGDDSPPKTIGGGTYARALKHGVAFGFRFPGEEETAHITDEYIETESLMKAGAIIAEAIYRMSKDRNLPL